MRRGGSARRYLRLLERIRELAPDVFLRSTFIVGFPGETESTFRGSLGFRATGSIRPPGRLCIQPGRGDTGSRSLGPGLTGGCAGPTSEASGGAATDLRSRVGRDLVGQTLPVLVEGPCTETEHLLEGRHHGMAPEIDGRILINDGIAPAAEFVSVKITEAHADDLVGHIVGPTDHPGIQVAGCEADPS